MIKNNGNNVAPPQSATYFWLSSLILVYAAARFLQVLPGNFPMLAIVALHVLPPLLFAWLHGAMRYGVRDIFVFFAIGVVVGNIVENIGLRSGFPFGHYYFTGVMGPKLFQVPIFLGLAYLGMGYLSWTTARVILGDARAAMVGSRVVALPLVAAFLMVAWDLGLDPVWATIVRAWVWRDGGSYFGVPLSNFFGWYINVYVIYQLFAIYMRRRSTNLNALPRVYWRLPVLFYAVSAAGNLLLLIPRPGFSVVSDPTGRAWQVSSITGACALVSIFLMGAFAVLAWVRIAERGVGAAEGSG
jgi:uncharacterized membrane protein